MILFNSTLVTPVQVQSTGPLSIINPSVSFSTSTLVSSPNTTPNPTLNSTLNSNIMPGLQGIIPNPSSLPLIIKLLLSVTAVDNGYQCNVLRITIEQDRVRYAELIIDYPPVSAPVVGTILVYQPTDDAADDA
ncbi:hypothetical protein HK100_010636 [Physocladia obscura]|uniref:Uncharacterized protein n=1 Tax=Physocladia obscura TaxID=109957 RepID=A0AAD5X5M2_9FUNG|nr:hypothetical protein HK100_010636 [Physocladia obscura]